MSIKNKTENNPQIIEKMIVKKGLFSLWLWFPREIKKENGIIEYYISWIDYYGSLFLIPLPFIFSVVSISLLAEFGLISEYDSLGYIHISLWIGLVLLGYIVLIFFKPRSIVISKDGVCTINNRIIFQKGEIENIYIVTRNVPKSKYIRTILYDIQYKLHNGSMQYLYSSFSKEEVFSSCGSVAQYCNIGVVDCTSYVLDRSKKLGSEEANKPITGKKLLLILIMIFGSLFLLIVFSHLINL